MLLMFNGKFARMNFRVVASSTERPATRFDRLWLLFRAAALLTAVHFARATDYFVDPASEDAFPTIQAAVDAVAGQSEFNRANIFIAPGVYRELVTVSKPYISLIGQGDSPKATAITFSRTVFAGDVFSWDPVVEIQSGAALFMARNLTFENSTLDRNLAAALALRCAADRAIFDQVRVLGYQDTLLVDESSRQYFRDSFISGDSDFIFGNATAVFDQCTIESTDSGYITAANTAKSTANGLVFLDCTLVPGVDRNPGDNQTGAGNATVFLGRPWGWYEPDTMPSVIFLRTKMGHHIIAAGWDPWDVTGVPGINPNTNRDPFTRLSEFGSMDLNGNLLPDANGDGTPAGRVPWTDPITEEQAGNYTLEHIFGPADFWNSETQPETSEIPYQSQGAPWHPISQLALIPTEPGIPSQPLNISTRVSVQTDDNVLIAGFILTGSTPKEVMLRAIGPSLENAGIHDALADPTIELRGPDGTRLAFNNNWKYAAEEEIIATGIPPADDYESAIHITLSPGAYTAIVKGRDRTTGVALVEVYDLDARSETQLANISTRGFIEGGDHVMIAGFILAGGSGGSRVIIRGLGPSLAAAGVVQALADPMLELRDSNGVSIAFNDDWKEAQRTEIEELGIPPTDDRESSIVASLPAGPYTAVLAGRGGSTGVGLIEVYNLK